MSALSENEKTSLLLMVTGKFSTSPWLGSAGPTQEKKTLNETIKIESIIGSTFEVKVIEKIKIGLLNGVIPEVKGTANITGKNTFWIDSSDNIGEGFMLR